MSLHHPLRPPRAIGFDLGETLLTYAEAPLNWASLYRPALTEVAAALEFAPSAAQFAASETILASYNTRLSPRIQEFDADQIFSRVFAGWSMAETAVLSQAIEVFFRFFQQSLRAYPDTLPALQGLRSLDLPVGVLTDVPYGMPRVFVEQDLAQAGIASSVDVLLTSVDIGYRKPSPQGIHRLMLALGAEASSFLYVGNEPKDIQAAKAAGVFSVLIDRDGVGPQWGQDCTVGSLSEVVELVARSGV